MSEPITTAQLHELVQGDGAFFSETRDIGAAQILVAKSGSLSYVEVRGCYNREVGQYLERVARSCPANLGIAFKDIRRDPNSTLATKFDAGVVMLLKRIQQRCESKGHQFALCDPPSELLEVFVLTGAKSAFTIIDQDGNVRDRAQTTGKGRPGPEDLEARDTSQDVRKIQWFGGTIQRTAHIEKELDSAAECVARFLPKAAPQTEGWSIGFSYKSCEKIGGDFFDFIELDADRIGLCVGDVTGHGLDAALIMGITKKLISVRARDRSMSSPAAVLKQVNRDLAGDLNPKTFVTAIYGTLDLRSGIFHYARAGHEFPIIFRGSKQKVPSSKGLALGMGRPKMFDQLVEDAAVRIDPGVNLLLVSDGIAECRNDKDALFSRDRILFELRQGETNETAQVLLDRLLEKVHAFRNGRSQEDDMTAILIQRFGH